MPVAHSSRAAQLAAYIAEHPTGGLKPSIEPRAERITQVGNGIPATTHDFVTAVDQVSEGDSTGHYPNEVYIMLDPQVVTEVIDLAWSDRLADDKRQQIEFLIGRSLYPQVVYRDGDGDTIIIVTDGDRGNA